MQEDALTMNLSARPSEFLTMNWLTQLRRFIAQVIDPDSGTSRAPPDKLHSIVTLAHSSNPSHTAAVQYDVFPVFDENGIQVAFQRVPRKIAQPSSTATANPTHLQSSNYSSKPQAEVNIIKPEKNWRDLPAFDLSNPAPQTSFIPLDPQPSSSSSLDDGIIATSLEQLPGGIWDPWANGRFYMNLSHLEYSQNKQLGVHWATKNNSSQNGKGSTNSSYLDGGKITNKKCLGVVTCSGEDCDFVYRPRVSPENLAKQLENPCANCSASLIHVPCNSRSYLIRYGQLGNDTSTLKYRYINGSPHNHSHIPNVTRTTATEDIKFLAAYQSRPDATPSQMMAGPPAPTGFGPGAAEIGHKFRSQGYTGYSLRRLRAKDGNGPSSAFGFFTKLGDWKKLYPDVLCQDFTSSTINCLSLQTEWMRQQTLPDMTQVDEPLHGILSDAAHKYWEDPNGRLIVSSIFSPLINKWIPILFTYANGATTAHYEYHFLVLIQGIVRTALECSIAITDDLFVGSWFNQMAIVEKADKAVHLVPGCWRQESQDDVITGVCAGKSRQIQFLVDLPVLLNIVSDYQAGKAWTFPLELYIGSKSAAIRQGLVYDLVGVVLSNGNHFTTLTAIPTTSNSKAVFAYDGMTNGGFSKYIPGKPAALMTGLHPSGAPTGFHVHAVLYKLRESFPPVFTESDWIQIISGSTSFSEYNHTSSSLDIPTALMTQTTIPRNFIDLSKPNFNVTDSIPTPLSSPGQQVKSSSPPPSSPQPIHCRCGIQADGHREAVVQVTVQFSNIVDGLWKDAAGRRTLQLGHYTRPLEESSSRMISSDELLLDWRSIKCTTEMHHALDPHKKILLDLSTTPSTDTRFATFSNTKIPALSYQPSKNSQYPSATNPTLYRGGLLDTDLAGIRNWFFEHLGSKTIAELEFHHLLDYSIAHARTLLLAFRHRNAFASSNESYDSEEILLKAWNRLQEWNGLTVDGSLPHQEGADVNLEAITLLDKIMFDESKRAGVAGNHQWGLDKGPHEAGIDPQLVGPRVTQENERREGDDDIEIVFGPNYTGGVVAETNVPDEQKPSPKRPRPRPITKRKALDAEISQDKRQKRQKTDDAEDSDVEMK
ncbi:hypothetical protein D9757_011758 [Collybiopsis confluens]|uniref:Uncharacterized protein n=1 Tax=Collybiopsis confluens TaxID=2823264 RepID=A0A8H5GHN1_9AGAR|nr:hypothetical protein D9757_011758 [Collybiopsis confluens]